MKPLMLILVLSGMAVSQTTTKTDCTISGSGHSANCTSTSEEEKRLWNDTFPQRYETPSEHERWKAERAQARAEAAATEQRQREAAEQRQREADKIAAQKQEAFLATPEGQRQAKLEYEEKQKQAEAGKAREIAANELARKMWLVKHPEYKDTEANNNLMEQYIDAHNLDWVKAKSYEKAFKALSKAGLLEK